MKKNIDTKKHLFENMAKINFDFKLNESVDFNLLGGQYKDNVAKQAEEIKAKIDAWVKEGEDDAINAIHSFLTRKGKPFPLPSSEELDEIFDKLNKNGR
jgi:hypothetical protein